MSVQEIKAAIERLSPPELAELAQWFEEFQADAWDRQIARDVEAGRFDAIFRQVEEQAAAGLCRPWSEGPPVA